MKKLIIALAFITLLSCKEEVSKNVDYALFSGTVTNSDAKTVNITGNGFSQKIDIDEDGKFSDTLRLSDGKYSFTVGPELSALYFDQGDDINLTIDTKLFDESIVYTGIGSEKNNYLAQLYLLEEKSETYFGDIFKMKPEDFKKNLNTYKESCNSLLKGYKIENSSFVEMAKSENNYFYLYNLQRYILRNDSESFADSYADEITSLDLDDEQTYKKSDYFKQILAMSVHSKVMKAILDDKTLSEDKVFIDYVSEFKSDIIKDDLFKMLSRKINTNNKNSEFIYNQLMALLTDSEFKEELKVSYKKTNKLVKGKESPSFKDYENYKGGTTSLAELKGKYVYIDIWATWCGPCVREFPALKEIEHKYRGKNIEFLSISIDSDNAHDKWREMIKDNELRGVQLYANGNPQAEFLDDYMVNSIPRFVLLDPEGKIVNAYAPRPSSGKLEELFDSLEFM